MSSCVKNLLHLFPASSRTMGTGLLKDTSGGSGLRQNWLELEDMTGGGGHIGGKPSFIFTFIQTAVVLDRAPGCGQDWGRAGAGTVESPRSLSPPSRTMWVV